MLVPLKRSQVNKIVVPRELSRLRDKIGLSYPLNPCNFTYQGYVYSFSSRYVL